MIVLSKIENVSELRLSNAGHPVSVESCDSTCDSETNLQLQRSFNVIV
jgi:hypothetical protein